MKKKYNFFLVIVSFFLFSTFAEEDAIGATVVQDWEKHYHRF
ncbi:hypothetical protein [Treponema phagedenis]|nr:hypothetical protein [Treponema phagedenis]